MYVIKETETVATLEKMLNDMKAWKTKVQSENPNVDVRIIDGDIESLTSRIAEAVGDEPDIIDRLYAARYGCYRGGECPVNCDCHED